MALVKTYKEHLEQVVKDNGGSLNRGQYQRKTNHGGHTHFVYIKPNEPEHGTVVFSHGMGNDAWFPHFRLFQFFVSNNCAVFSFDLDGHGQTSTTIWDPYRRTEPTALAQAIAQAKELDAPKPFHLVGYSLGGAIVLDHLIHSDDLDQVGSCCIIGVPANTAPPKWQAVATELLTAFTPSFWSAASTYGLLGALPSLGKFRRNEFPIRFRNDDGSAFDYLRAVGAMVGRSVPEPTTKLQRDVLALYGEFDLISDSGLQKLAAHAQVHCQQIDRENHFTTLFSPMIMRRILDWIEGSK